MKAILCIFGMICATAFGQDAATTTPYKVERKEVPEVFCVPLRLLPVGSTKPRDMDAMTIGVIAKDHITLHERRFEIAKCILANDGRERTVEVLCKPDAVGSTRIVIVQPLEDGLMPKKCMPSIEHEPHDLTQKTAIATYMILLP